MKALSSQFCLDTPTWVRRALDSLLDDRTRSHIDPASLRVVFERKKESSHLWGLELMLREAAGPMGRRRWVTLRRADADRLREEDRRLAHHLPLASRWCDPLPAFATDEAGGVSLRCFPLDRRLPSLPRQLEARALTRLLVDDTDSRDWRLRKRRSEVEILSYRPERRVVARWTTNEIDDRTRRRRQRRLVVRIHDRRLPSRRDLYRSLESAGILAPRWVADGDRGEQVETCVAGEPLAMAELPSAAALGTMGAILARLHSRIPTRVLERGPDDSSPLDRARSAISNLGSRDRLRADPAMRWLSELEGRTAPRGPMVVLHGDMHPGQLLRAPAGMAIIDWDRVTVGSPEQDLANLVAHLQIHGATRPRLEPLLSSYRALAPIDAGQLEWHRRAHLLRLSDLHLRRPADVVVDWPDRVLATLREEVTS